MFHHWVACDGLERDRPLPVGEVVGINLAARLGEWRVHELGLQPLGGKLVLVGKIEGRLVSVDCARLRIQHTSAVCTDSIVNFLTHKQLVIGNALHGGMLESRLEELLLRYFLRARPFLF